MMRFSSRTFWLPKDLEYPNEYQDAFALAPERGTAAIADGVTSGIFSRSWANLLTQDIVACPQVADDPATLEAWLGRQRTAWRANIDLASLPWNLRPKLADGAMTTLLWVELCAADDASPACRLRGAAIGDCCLFHLRDGQLLGSFPMSTSEAFGLSPQVLRSVPQGPLPSDLIQRYEAPCLAGDQLVLATDALALWAIERLEAGEQVAWEPFWEMTEEAWCSWIGELRQQKRIRYDDTTLVLLRVLDESGTAAAKPDSLSEDPAPCPTDPNPSH